MYIDKKDLVLKSAETSEVTPEQMYDYLVKTTDKFENQDIKKVVNYMLEENKEKLLKAANSLNTHHTDSAGLLQHTYNVLNLAEIIIHFYEPIHVNSDLVYGVAIIHDLGKLKFRELNEDGTIKKIGFEEDFLKNHLYIGAAYAAEVCNKLNVSQDVSVFLQHLILSHHGIMELGAVLPPQTFEGQIIRMCDTLDCRIWMYNSKFKDVEPGGSVEFFADGEDVIFYRPNFK